MQGCFLTICVEFSFNYFSSTTPVPTGLMDDNKITRKGHKCPNASVLHFFPDVNVWVTKFPTISNNNP